jgi:hypothetical protein
MKNGTFSNWINFGPIKYRASPVQWTFKNWTSSWECALKWNGPIYRSWIQNGHQNPPKSLLAQTVLYKKDLKHFSFILNGLNKYNHSKTRQIAWFSNGNVSHLGFMTIWKKLGQFSIGHPVKRDHKAGSFYLHNFNFFLLC